MAAYRNGGSGDKGVKQGYLSQYFDDVAVKWLSAVEIDKIRSNQHEFNSDEELKKLLEDSGKNKIQCKVSLS